MTDIQVTVGIKQLDWIIGERRKIANKYTKRFKDIDCIRLP